MKVIADTERLKIRVWSPNDAEEFLRLSQDSGFNQFSITKYKQSSLEDAKGWVEREEQYFQRHGIGVWAVIRKEDESLVGICGLRYYPDPEIKGDVEVTYRFAESAWGKGYGTEATFSCMEFGFSQLGLPEIIAVIDPKNDPSKTILRKVGMTFHGNELYRGDILVERYSRLNMNTATSKRPDFIKHYAEIQEQDNAHYPGSDELLSVGSPFAKTFGLKRLGIHHELLHPGRRTSWPHAEQDEEEFVYVIEGNPHVWIDGEIHELKLGDGVGFPCGTGISHTFINNTDRDVRLIVIGEASKKTSKIYYPLNPERKEQVKDRRCPTFCRNSTVEWIGFMTHTPPQRPLIFRGDIKFSRRLA